ncbi:MAG TPA: hypothetical protein VFO14_15025 [Vicinamibacterales bacterium]|nr:hypothetical protein [Vicinamibacterales bacterium]
MVTVEPAYASAVGRANRRGADRRACWRRDRADGAAPLIGSGAAIREVRERIERVAATVLRAHRREH